MQNYFNNVINRYGDACQGIAITVTNASNDALASIFSDNGVTPAPNPLTTDANGRFSFYAADGRYNLALVGLNFDSVVITDVLLYDPVDPTVVNIDGGGIQHSALSNVTIDGEPPVSQGELSSVEADLAAHEANVSNPHSVTKAQVGLGNADNTSDANKPISTAAQTAINSVTSNLSAHEADLNNPHEVTKTQIGLSNVDNTSDINKPVSIAQAMADAVILVSAETYANGLVINLWDDRGIYDASSNVFPSSGGSGTAGAILKGDIWTINIVGTLGGNPVQIGDTVRALIDAPGQTNTNWAVGQNNIGYVPENIANKNVSGGYVGLTGFSINLKNFLGTVSSLFTTAATLARIWTMPDKDGTVAMISDITKAQVGLSNVDNTSDINKPVSTAQAAADATILSTSKSYTDTGLTTKEPIITAGTTSQYWRGDKSWQTLDKTAVGLSNVENKSSATIRGEITSGNVTTALGYTPYDASNPSNYINSSGAPVQSVAGKTGAVTLVTADVSGAAPLINPTFVGVPAAPTATVGTNTTQIATTAFVLGQSFITSSGAPVQSVAGKTGVVTLTSSDVGLGNVENKSSATIRGEITSGNVTSALGYTPYNATNPSSYITSAGAPVQSVAGKTGTVTLTTSDVSEGSNLYYTDARSRAAISASGDLSYNSSTGVISYTAGATSINNGTQDFRLTLTSGTPVTISDVTGATTIYCTPYTGNRIALYVSSAWVLRTTSEFSLALGTLTSGKPYDVYCYDNSGTPTLEFLVWTNDTTRATALAYQDGVLVKSGDSTRRYIGTFYTTATTTTEDSTSKRYLVNYYHRVARNLFGFFTTNRATTSASFVELNPEIRCNFLSIGEDACIASAAGSAFMSLLSSSAYIAIGYDGTTAEEGSNLLNGSTNITCIGLGNSRLIASGKHYATVLGNISGGQTLTVNGGATVGQRAALRLAIWG